MISKRILLLILAGNLFVSIVSGLVYGQEPVDYVNPNIGTIGHLLTATTPDVQLPRGMIRFGTNNYSWNQRCISCR